MKFADKHKFTCTVAAGVITTLTVGAAPTGFRNVAQVVADGTNDTTAIKVGDSNIAYMVGDSAGNWERAYYTITSTSLITKGAIISSSNGGAAVSFAAGTVTVLNDPPEDWMRKVVVNTDGQNLTDLPAFSGTPSDSCVFIIQDPATGLAYKIGVAALKTLFASTPAQTITVNNPGAQVAGTAFTVSGAYANGTPTALDYSINGGSTWNAASSPTISGGTFSFGGVTIPSANASQTIMVRDHTTNISGTSASFAVSAPETLTVNTPTTQTVGTAFPVTGTYANGTPTALDYRLSDDAAGVWTQVASATISGGTFSFNLTPASTSAGRTVSVRDRNNTGVTATSGSYVVNSAPSTVSGVTVTPATPTVVGGQTVQLSASVSGTNSPSQSVTWSMLSGVGTVSASGLYTAPVATASAQTATVKALSNQDGTTYGTATVTIPAQTITVTNPGTQTVGTPYTLSGTWTGAQPAALDFQTTDNGGTPTAWGAASSPTINSNGTWSFSVNPSTSSSSRTISVRDHTTNVVGTSTAYVVNAAALTMAQTYQLTNTNSASMVAGTSAATLSSPDYYAVPAGNIRVNVRDSGGITLNPARVKLIFGLYTDTNCPLSSFATTSLPQGANGTTTSGGHNNGVAVGTALGGWNYTGATSQSNYGTMTPGAAFYAWFGTGAPLTGLTSGQTVDMKLWVLYDDNSAKAHDNNTGTPIKFTFTVP